MSNPISFKEFFDFSDRSAIEMAKQDMRDLKTVYNEFVGAVVGGQMSLLAKQESEVSEATKELLTATRELSVANKDQQKTLIANSEALEKLRTQLETVRESKKNTAKQEEILGNSVDALTQRLKLQIAEFNKLDPTVDDNADRLLALGKSTAQTREAIKQLTDQTRTTTAIFTAAKGSYIELDLQTKQLKRDLLEMADGFNPANAGATALKKQIFENTEALKKFDAQININNRNVGNYADGFKGAKSQFQQLNLATSQIFRELPSLAVSVNTFFLAISNNLPMLFDELKRAKVAIDEAKAAQAAATLVAKEQAAAQALAAGATQDAANKAAALAEAQALANANTGKSTTVFKAFLGSVFSFNTAMTVGITLLTLFGGKVISAFTGASEEAKKAAEEAKKFNDQLKKIDQDRRTSIIEQNILLSAYNRTATNTALSEEQRRAAAEKMQKLFPGILDNLSQEAILEGKAAAAILTTRDAIIARAKAEASAKKLSLAIEQQDKGEQNRQEAAKKLIEEIEYLKTRTVVGGDMIGDIPKRTLDAETLQTLYEQALDAAKELNANTGADEDYVKSLEKKKVKFDELTKSTLKAANAVRDFGSDVQKYNEETSGLIDTPEEGSRNDLERRLKRVKDYLNTINPLNYQYNALKKEQIDLEAQIAKLDGKKTKAEKDAEAAERARAKAERERLAAIKKHDDQIKASEKLEIASAELVFARSQQYVLDEIALEQAKVDAISKSVELRKVLYKKDSKEYESLLAEKAIAEGNFITNRNKAYDAMVAKDKETNSKLLQQAKDTIKASGEAYAAEDERAFSNQINEVALRVAGRKLTPQQGEDAVHKLKAQRLQEEIDNQRAIVDSAQIQDAAYYNAKKTLSDKLKALDDENASYAIRKEEEVQRAKTALLQTAFEFAGSVSQSLYENEASKLDKELSDLQLKYDTDIKLAGDNKSAKDRIDEEYNKASNELKRQQAELQKEQTIFNIGLTTAEKIIQAYPNPILIAAAAAAGAIQIGLVASREIPSYWKGRSDGPAEVAEVNERGTELIRSRRTGKYRIAAGGERGLTMLDKGDEVLTHDKSVKLAKERYLKFGDTDDFVDSMNDANRNARDADAAARYGLVAALAGNVNRETLTASFKDALADLPIEENHFDDNGHRRYTRRRNTRVQSLNERNRMGGKG